MLNYVIAFSCSAEESLQLLKVITHNLDFVIQNLKNRSSILLHHQYFVNEVSKFLNSRLIFHLIWLR